MRHTGINAALARVLANNARGFLSYQHPCDLDCTLQSRYHRLAIALELALKNHLIFYGASDEANRMDIGHDLGIAAQRAMNEGLRLTPAILALIAEVHPFFMRGGFARELRTDWNAERAEQVTLDLDALLSMILITHDGQPDHTNSLD